VQNRVQQRAMDCNAAVVIYEAQLAELIHEKADARARRADHLRKPLLADLGRRDPRRADRRSVRRAL